MSNVQSNTSSNPTKTVLYYGKEIQVPQKAKWIHTDSNGYVFWSVVEAPLTNTCFDTVSTKIVYGRLGSFFNHTQMSTINWMLSQKRISDLPSVCTGLEHTPHVHADLMLKYAQIAQYSDKPWEEFQSLLDDGLLDGDTWIDCYAEIPFFSTVQYRLKPQVVETAIWSGQVWRSNSVGVKVTVSTYDLCKGTVLVRHEIDAGLYFWNELSSEELRKYFTLVK